MGYPREPSAGAPLTHVQRQSPPRYARLVLLEDGVVTVRPFAEDDVPAIAAACRDPEIARWTLVPEPYTEDDARAFVGSAQTAYAVVDLASGALVGAISLDPAGEGNGQIGYWVAREARGRGVATRALQLVSRWGLAQRGFARVQLLTEPENVASQRVAERAGFTNEGLLRSYAELKGRRRDMLMWSLLPTDL